MVCASRLAYVALVGAEWTTGGNNFHNSVCWEQQYMSDESGQGKLSGGIIGNVFPMR